MINCAQDLITCPGYNFPVHRYPQNGCGCPPPNSPVISIGAILPNKQGIIFANSNIFATDGRAVRLNRVHDIANNQDASSIRSDQSIIFRKPYKSPPKVAHHYPNMGVDNAQGQTSITYSINGNIQSRIPNIIENIPVVLDDILLDPDTDYFFPVDVCTLPPPSPCPSPSYSPSPSPSYSVSPCPSPSYSPSPSVGCVSDSDCDGYCVENITSLGCYCMASTISSCGLSPGQDLQTQCAAAGGTFTPNQDESGPCSCIVGRGIEPPEGCGSLSPSTDYGGTILGNGYCCNGSCQDTPCI